jgi:Ca2+-binding RTX toxin-like protein
MRVRTTLLAATAAVLLIPAASQAATLKMDGNTVVYDGRGGSGTDLLLSTYEDWNSGVTYLSFGDSEAPATISTNVCHKVTGIGSVCDLDENRPIRVEGSESKDYVSITSAFDVPDSIPMTFNGNGGNDTLKDAYNGSAGRVLNGGAGNDEVTGYAGNDALDGGDGNDVLDGGEGDDQVRAGAGNDELDGDGYKEPGSDLVDGGPGYDYVDGWNIPSDLDQQPPVDITLDGVANDGRPGENDNVIGVEDFKMYVVGSFVGTDGPEKIVLANPGNDGPSTLIGRGGNDQLVAHDFNDTVDGGAGDDQVEGGLGNDTVTGGPGQDTIYGDATASSCTLYSCKIPFGNDVINARDGEVDNIDCGIGQDKAIVDTIDIVTNCETVDGSGPRGGGGPGSGPGGSALSIKVGAAKLRTLASKGLTIKVPCASACSVKGSMTADKATARKLGTKKVASGKGKTGKAGTAKVTLKTSRKVARKLKKLKTAKVTIKVTVTPKGGAKQTASRKLTLKR